MYYSGVGGSGTSLTIQSNTIINNQNGITIAYRYTPTISNNNIFNNQVNLQLSGQASLDVDAVQNWWGTTDTALIDNSIYDFYDDFNLGKVNYTPILNTLNPSAPNPNMPIPTPPSSTPSPSPTATSSPATTPTPTSSAEPQQTGQLEIIIGAAIALTVIGAGLGLLIYLIKRK